VKVAGVQFPTICTQPSIVVAVAKRNPTMSLVPGSLVAMVEHHPLTAEMVTLGKDRRVDVFFTIRCLAGVFLHVSALDKVIK